LDSTSEGEMTTVGDGLNERVAVGATVAVGGTSEAVPVDESTAVDEGVAMLVRVGVPSEALWLGVRVWLCVPMEGEVVVVAVSERDVVKGAESVGVRGVRVMVITALAVRGAVYDTSEIVAETERVRVEVRLSVAEAVDGSVPVREKDELREMLDVVDWDSDTLQLAERLKVLVAVRLSVTDGV
jgi:hypothetical protein